MTVLQIMSHMPSDSLDEFYFYFVIVLLSSHGISARFDILVTCCLNFTHQLTKLNKLSHFSITAAL